MAKHLVTHCYRQSLLLLVAFILSVQVMCQGMQDPRFAKADSLFMEKKYPEAKASYTALLKGSTNDALHLNRLGYCEYSMGDNIQAERHYRTALSLQPPRPLKASILSRLARIDALKGLGDAAIDDLDSAVNAGYLAVREIDTVKDFGLIRADPKFIKIRDRLFNSLYPCVNDLRSKEFDFWLGQWDVYVSGTNMFAGHSLIQKVSGGCALLENWNSLASEGKSLNYIDDSTGKWKQVWVGSYASGKQDFVDGVYKDSAMRFRFETTDSQGNKVLGRFTFFNQGPIQVRQLNETSTDGGKTWVIGYDFIYKRKK